MGIGYILLAILVFGILIFIHEFGHFICARKCGVEIKEFAIGMGPKILQWKSREYDTQYSLRLLPIGGYVSMLGEDEESDSENSFGKKSVWKRLLIISAGPIMNLVLGFLVMVLIVALVGSLYSNTIYYTEDIPSISQSCGLQDGDTITKVGNTRVHTWYELSYEVMNQGYEPIDITLNRNGETIKLEDVVFPTKETSGVLFGDVDFLPQKEEFTVVGVLKHSFFRGVSTVKMVVDSFVDLIGGRFGIDSMSGPVGITQAIGGAASLGFIYFLYMFAVITINLGVFNLFPIPALDGGRLLFLLAEAIIGRPLNRKIEGYVHFIGLILILFLALYVTFNDILRLF